MLKIRMSLFSMLLKLAALIDWKIGRKLKTHRYFQSLNHCNLVNCPVWRYSVSKLLVVLELISANCLTCSTMLSCFHCWKIRCLLLAFDFSAGSQLIFGCSVPYFHQSEQHSSSKPKSLSTMIGKRIHQKVSLTGLKNLR